MKKILSLFLILIFTFTLAGCDMFGDDDEIPDEIIDCILDPEGAGCEDLIPVDDRSSEEIIADAIVEGWDGDITHLNLLLDLMDFTESMETVVEFNFDVMDEENEQFFVNVVMTDSFLFADGADVLERHMVLQFDGRTVETTFIFEEIATGVNIYVEISDLVDELEIEEPEVIDIMTILGVDQDWLKFTFDDTLANMVEIEVMKDLLFDILFKEVGEDVFIDLQAEILSEVSVDLDDYDLDLDALMTLLETGNYTGFRAGVDAIDWDGLLLALDEVIVEPEIVDLLTENSVDLTAEGWNVPAEIVIIEANGTEAWLGTLTDEEMIEFFAILTKDEWALIDLTYYNLDISIPWQAITNITLPVVDIETGATISWYSNMPAVISTAGVVTRPVADDWNAQVELIADITVGDKTEQYYFYVHVPPVNAGAEWGNEYNDYDYYDNDDPLGDYLKETINLYDIIQFVKGLKDALLVLDYTAIELETVDLELLIDAIYEDQAAFDAFVIALATTAPEKADLLAAFSPIVGYLEENILMLDVKYALDNLTMFEDYLTFAYYVDNNYVDLTIGQTPTFGIVTTATLEPDAFGTLFASVVGTASNYLDGFTDIEIPYLEHLHCPVGETTCEEWDEYEEIIARLNQYSHLEVITTYDPAVPGEMETVVDFTSLLNAIINTDFTDEELLDRALDKLDYQIPWQVISVIDLPTADIENEATIVWTSSDSAVISIAGVVTPHATEWRYVDLTAVVTVGTESETLYYYIHVPPVNATGLGDEYYYNSDDIDYGIYDLTSATDVSLTITVKDSATVTIPAATNDVNAIAEDFARFSLSILAHDYAEQIAEYYIDNPAELITDFGLTGATKALSHYEEEFKISKAFDADLSEIVIGGTLAAPTFSIKLVWIDTTDVFDAPLTLAELASMFGEGEGGPDTAAIFQYYVDEVNETNFNMTKLLFIFIFTDDNDDEYYD